MEDSANDTTRSWDAMVSDLETLTAEMRAKCDGDAPEPPEPPDGDVIYVDGGDLAAAIKDAPAGAVLDLCAQTFTQAALTVDKPLTLQNGTLLAAPNISDMLELKGQDITLRDLVLRGNGTTKRGIANQAANTTLQRVRVENICREGQESQAMAMWSSPGPLLAEDCHFEAGSICFLAGGSTPAIANTIATGLTFRRCTFTRPLEFRGAGYAVKSLFELKCAKDVLVEDCDLSNCWKDGQTGFAFVFTPSQYGGSPETTVANVTVRNCRITNVGGGLNGLGYSQHQNDPDRQTQQGGSYRFEGNTWQISMADNGGQGALMQLGWEPRTVEWIDNDVTADGGAFLRVTDEKPIEGYSYRGGRVDEPGTYGVFAPDGSRGVNWQTIAPSGVIEGVTFINAHSTFKANFPANTYESA